MRQARAGQRWLHRRLQPYATRLVRHRPQPAPRRRKHCLALALAVGGRMCPLGSEERVRPSSVICACLQSPGGIAVLSTVRMSDGSARLGLSLLPSTNAGEDCTEFEPQKPMPAQTSASAVSDLPTSEIASGPTRCWTTPPALAIAKPVEGNSQWLSTSISCFLRLRTTVKVR